MKQFVNTNTSYYYHGDDDQYHGDDDDDNDIIVLFPFRKAQAENQDHYSLAKTNPT